MHGRGDDGSAGTRSFGRLVRRRRLALDLTQAALARRVGCSADTIKKIEHDLRRPSRTMATRLAASLELRDEDLDPFVAIALGERRPDGAPLLRTPPPPSGPDGLEAWLGQLSPAPAPGFVGRGAELDALDAHLARSCEGGGHVTFIAGEAGQGKTALLAAFATRAQATVPDLLVARGTATAAGGHGDPYLPFRDVLTMLLADPDAGWQRDQLDRTQATRLWRAAPSVAASLLRTGPQLLDILVPRSTVLMRARDGSILPPAGDGDLVPSRDQLVAQLTATLHAVSLERPLLLLLDDLQWIDVASAEVLFHLSRRLHGGRVLVVSAFRGSEVWTPPEGPQAAALRLLRRTTLEVRTTGEEVIDLDATDHDGSRQLCDDLVDREPNLLDDRFRAQLFERTGGHPLFVVELLRELQDGGALERDGAGRWVQTGRLDWQSLPSRISAVVEQRLARVDDAARAVLEVAAVEGERFTAEVIADVLDQDVAVVLDVLDRQLERGHRLVHEIGAVRDGDRTLTRFRFGHVLFQQHLADALGTGRRRLLHGRLAAELAARDVPDDDPMVAQLAHHYAEAGDGRNAVGYLLRAGDRARSLYANEEAVRHYERAVGFLRELGDDERLGRTLMKLGLTHQLAFEYDQAQRAYDEAFGLLPATAARDEPQPGQDAGTQRPAASPTLRLVWADLPTLDPTFGGADVSAPLTIELFAGLVTYGENLEVLPDLAERWELEDGGRRYVFHLRDGLAWSDGVPLTAHDVAFTYRRALDPATGAPVARSLLRAVRGAAALRRGEGHAGDVGVRANDDRTLVIDLEEPTSYFIHNLAYYVLLPVPRHAVEAYGANWAAPEHLVTSGPFRLSSWRPGDAVELVRNPRYHGGFGGNVGRVQLDLGVAAGDQIQRYLEDRVDVLTDWFTPGTALEELSRSHPTEVSRRPEFSTSFFRLLPTRPPLDDVRVRRAMAMAVDPEAIAHTLGATFRLPATGGLVPPGMVGHVPGARLPFDPSGARAHLAAAGTTGGVELTIGVWETSLPVARALQQAWAAVGLASRVVTVGPFELERAFADLDVVAVGWWADYPDPDTFLRVCVEVALPGWTHAPYQELLAEAATSLRQDDRLAAYAEAERVLADEAVLVPLTHQRQVVACKPWIRRYTTLPVKHPGFWKDVVIDQQGAGAAAAEHAPGRQGP